MGVEYSATLGYGVEVRVKDIHDDPDGPWEVLERVTEELDLVGYAHGGGGYSDTDERYALLLEASMQDTGGVDGITYLKKPKITYEARKQLHDAYREATGKHCVQNLQWMLIGGFH